MNSTCFYTKVYPYPAPLRRGKAFSIFSIFRRMFFFFIIYIISHKPVPRFFINQIQNVLSHLLHPKAICLWVNLVTQSNPNRISYSLPYMLNTECLFSMYLPFPLLSRPSKGALAVYIVLCNTCDCICHTVSVLLDCTYHIAFDICRFCRVCCVNPNSGMSLLLPLL